MTNKKPEILLISHDQLAKGLLCSVRFFNKESENITAVAGYTEENDIKGCIVDWLNKNSECDKLIVSDIIGGSINQIAFKLLAEFDFYLISGMNLGLILEIMFLDRFNEENLSQAIKQAKEQIVLMNNIQINTEEEEF